MRLFLEGPAPNVLAQHVEDTPRLLFCEERVFRIDAKRTVCRPHRLTPITHDDEPARTELLAFRWTPSVPGHAPCGK
jgi:hypothetical protein